MTEGPGVTGTVETIARGHPLILSSWTKSVGAWARVAEVFSLEASQLGVWDEEAVLVVEARCVRGSNFEVEEAAVFE